MTVEAAAPAGRGIMQHVGMSQQTVEREPGSINAILLSLMLASAVL